MCSLVPLLGIAVRCLLGGIVWKFVSGRVVKHPSCLTSACTLALGGLGANFGSQKPVQTLLHLRRLQLQAWVGLLT